MLQRVLVAGILGAIVLMAWTFVAGAILGFNVKVRMNRIPNERAVYEVLKANVVAPGAYIVNPEVVPGTGYPPGEPVFGLQYAGFGHEAAGKAVLADPAIALVSCLIVAWLLSKASLRVLSSYSRKVCFVAGIGLLIAVFVDLPKYGIGGYPAKSALLLAAYDIISWTLAGLVIARVMRTPADVPEGS
ncbi:MAG: hypothetical protein NTW97_01010 [Candidatus Krumholzibacteria bacterium]|nr:hypothetical protein [Candidatus Krumholzibacteria bacterium]